MNMHVRDALEAFATSPENKAIILKGHWGVGKTHLWDGVVKSKKEKFGRGFYSYVSLFGLSSLKELRQAIYENLVSRNSADDSGGVRSMEERLEGTMGFLRKHSSLLSGIKGVGPVVESYQASAVNDVLICVDDFERKGKGLSDSEVLGLISQLVEKKKCSVILILNEEVSVDAKDDFSRYREKVFAYELEYAPASLESAKLILDDSVEAERDLIRRVERLNITNVRLIRKIKFYYDKVVDLLHTQYPKVFEEVRCVLPLAVLARYGSDFSPVTLDELEGFQGWVPSLLEPTEEERQSFEKREAQAAALISYGYHSTSELDKAMIHLVRKGYVDADTVKEVVQAMELSIKAGDAEELYKQAWLNYHSNFGLTQEDILDGFDRALELYGEYLSVDRLSSVVRLYRESGLDDKADLLIDKCFERLAQTRSLEDRRHLWEEPKDPKIKRMLDVYFERMESTMSLAEAVEFLIANRSTAKAVVALTNSSEDDFYDYLTNPDNYDVKGVAKFLLGAADDSNIFDDALPGAGKTIFMAIYGALKRVSSLSRIHEIRIRPLMTHDELYAKYIEE